MIRNANHYRRHPYMSISNRLPSDRSRDCRGFDEFPIVVVARLGANRRGADRDARRLDGIRRASLDCLTQTARPTQLGFGPAFFYLPFGFLAPDPLIL